MYIRKVKFIHYIGLPTTCGYQYCGDKTGFNVRAMFDQYYFALPVLHNIVHIFFCMSILPFYMFAYSGSRYSMAENYDCDKYFSIYA